MPNTRTTLPNFIVIGAQKAGTTSIYAQFKAHPQVFMSPCKEVAFFSDDGRYAMGREYYESFFVDHITCWNR
ncbi:MAG: hypothetical protein ACC655_08360 [Rhodothermia bacterium]